GRHTPVVLGGVEAGFRIQAGGSVGLGNFGEFVGDDVLVGGVFVGFELRVQFLQLLRAAAHPLPILAVVGDVVGFHFGESNLFSDVVRRADVLRSLEGQMLEQVRQPGFA